MKLIKSCLLILLLGFSTVLMAGGPPKVTDLLPEPFQIVLTSTWENSGGYNGTSDTFYIDEDRTALLQYVTCRIGHGPHSNTNTNFRLIADIVDGSMSEVVILASDMQRLETLTPSPIYYESSFDVISACIGKHCNGLGDGKYVSLTLKADRDDPAERAEYLHCVINGLIY